MQIVEYKTISMRMTDAFDLSETDKNFDIVINHWIEDGWQPLGAPFLILDKKWQQINQTMVKYAKPPEFESIRTPHSKLKEIPDGIEE